MMLVSKYDEFVRNSDYSAGRSNEDRVNIAIYGLAAEVGSVVSAIKKRLLSEDSAENWDEPNDEIIEEMGDVIWYCFALAQAANPGRPFNILAFDIANLKREISATDDRAEKICRILDKSKRAAFLQAAERFPQNATDLSFNDYQKAAFLTARTADRTLVEVCLALFWQLGAELFRHNLPQVERDLNKSVVDRPINRTLAEIAWHLAAIASCFKLDLGHVAEKNIEKVSYRRNRNNRTPLHDRGRPKEEQLPRKFEVAFVTIRKGLARMYLNGKQLGDDLTDNAYDNDGYRYHDVMHLVNAAKLGWSPVLRSMLGRKRKSNRRLDEIEDGARARIVEEAVIKAIHSEGIRLARMTADTKTSNQMKLFPVRTDISSRFLNIIRSFVADLEASKNRHWEWEDAIIVGHQIFYSLRQEGQGTITVDLDKRLIEFRPEVCVELRGPTAGLGTSCLQIDQRNVSWHDTELTDNEMSATTNTSIDRATAVCRKRAIMDALEIQTSKRKDYRNLVVTEIGDGRISVRSRGVSQTAMWNKGIIAFRTSHTVIGSAVHCTAIAIAAD
jgi:NTP pyrophosphatase (non-canonical NTP hydrolase)